MSQQGLVPPIVTVVIPTKDRSDYLPAVLGALQAQTLQDFAVVIVDDGSRDATAAVAAATIDGDPRFRVLSTPNRGPAAARNAGCAAGASEWVAFSDDDCIAQPGWLENLLEAAAAHDADVVQGCTRPDPSVERRRLPWLTRSMDVRSWSGRFQTCNLLVRRSSLAAVGGFNEAFPDPVGEDTDMGLRLVRAGARTTFTGDAVVHHRILVMSFREYLQRRFRWSHVVRLVATNPDARTVFPMRFVAYRLHLLFWMVLGASAGLVVAGRWPLVVPLVLGLTVVLARRSRFKGRSFGVRLAWAVPELVALAVGAVGFLVQSVRFRRLLL